MHDASPSRESDITPTPPQSPLSSPTPSFCLPRTPWRPGNSACWGTPASFLHGCEPAGRDADKVLHGPTLSGEMGEPARNVKAFAGWFCDGRRRAWPADEPGGESYVHAGVRGQAPPLTTTRDKVILTSATETRFCSEERRASMCWSNRVLLCPFTMISSGRPSRSQGRSGRLLAIGIPLLPDTPPASISLAQGWSRFCA